MMKIFFLQLFISLFSLSNLNCFAQNNYIDTSKKELYIPIELLHIEEYPYGNDSIDSIQRVNQIHEFADESPEFPGGQSELYKFLNENIQYPQNCIDEKISGKIYVKFTVMKDGTIQDITLLKKAHKSLNDEAVRVIESMPCWIPGKIKGIPVNVFYTLPINFTIN